MRLIATWKTTQNEAVEDPIRVRWADGQPATMADFGRIVTHTQSDPDIVGDIVEFSYEVSALEGKEKH
jgi:hypothetical protein